MDDMAQNYDDDAPSGKPSVLDDIDCFTKLKSEFEKDREHSAKWRDEAKEDYEFASGEQWTDDEKQVLRNQMRPAITFNRIGPVLDSVSGTEVGNRQEVRYYPRSEGDVQADEVISAAAKWFREQCDAEDEESDAFMDVITCGMGWTETRLDYEIDEEGAPVVDRIDPFEMYWDRSAKKRNLEDARRVYRVKSMPVDDALALIPDADESELHAAWAVGEKSDSSDETQEEARFYRPSKGEGAGENVYRDMVTIVECQWWERESVHLIADPQTGAIQQLDDARFKVFSKRADDLGLGEFKTVTMSKRVYYRAYLGRSLLLKEQSPFQGHFSYKCITGKRDAIRGTYYGLVRQMKDPQRWANKWLSQTLHIMNVNAKGGIIAEEGIAEDMRAFTANWAKPDAVSVVKAGVLSNPNGAKFQQKPMAQLPAGYFNLLEFAISSVRDASGVNLELLGMTDRQQAGVLEAQRKKAAMAILATLFDSLRRYRKSQGRLLLQIITEHLSDGRLIRIVGEEGEQYVPLIKQEGLSTYDIRVDDAPTAPHQREQTWMMLQQLIPVVKDQMTPDMWAALLPYSPLPTSVTQKLQKLINDGKAQASENQAKGQQLAEATAVADLQKTQSEVALNQARASTEGVKAQADLIEAMTPNPQPFN